MKSITKFFYLSIVLTFILSGCSGEALDKLWLKSDGWSRGFLLGDTVLKAPTEIVVEESGMIYGVLYPRSLQNDSKYQPELFIVNSNGDLQEKIQLGYETQYPRQSKLILLDGFLINIWIDSQQLKAIKFSRTGEVLSDVIVLSENEVVDEFNVIFQDGKFQLWYAGSRDDPGLYALSGTFPIFEKTLVDPQGIRVNLFIDKNENISVSWAHYPHGYGDVEFYYLNTGFGTLNLDEKENIFRKSVSPSRRIDGPVLAMDEELVYLIWSEAIVSGLQAGARTTYYMYFPIGRPDTIRPPMRISFPASQNLDQGEYLSETYQTGSRVLLGGIYPRTSSIENVDILPLQDLETMLVFRSRSEFKWRDFRNQVNVGYISDGLVTSYQPLSYTSAESYYPAVVNDKEGDLYITWLEKGENTFRVYLTTTDSNKKSTIDLISMDDYLYLGAEGIFGILAGAILSPFAAAVWGGAGLLAFIFGLVLSPFHKPIFRTVGEILSIVGGVYIFWWMKFATLPGINGDYVPFSAWIPRIPSVMERPLMIGVPILIGVISAAVAWSKTYGKGSGSPINFHLIYSALDALLSCAIYGILIYGAF